MIRLIEWIRGAFAEIGIRWQRKALPRPSEIQSNADHVYHVWMNRRQEEIRGRGGEWEHSLYEFTSLVRFLGYGWKQIRDAWTWNLRKTHQQCSHQAAEPVQNNCLKCCLGVDVTKCDILISIKTVFDQERGREVGPLGKYYSAVTEDYVYQAMGRTCAWHIYKKVTHGTEGFHGVDTSEGHLMDVSDRMFWDRTYASMAGNDEGTESE